MFCGCEGSCPACCVGEVENHRCNTCGREYCPRCHGISHGGPSSNVLSCSCTVHALLHSLPLCGFSQDVPDNWPERHFWTEVGDVGNINCLSCKEAAEEKLGRMVSDPSK